MHIDFSSLFHRSSKDRTAGGRVQIPSDPRLWPEEFKRVQYKSYSKLPRIPLLKGRPQADLFETMQNRRSSRTFSHTPITIENLSYLLQYSCGITHTDSQFRTYPSAGARYPIEIYPIVFRGSDEIPTGVYHYNVLEHALDVLWHRPFTAVDISKLFSYEWVQDAALAIVMSGAFDRTQMKYGERGYRYVLLEAGHISENFYLSGNALGLKCCAMAASKDELIEELLDIDGITESVVHSLIFGVKDRKETPIH